MKINKIFALIALGALFCGCDQKLPYDLEGTEHGVVISISKVPGTDGILSTDMNSGNYKVKLDLPIYQGDYSMFEEAQVMAVYTDGNRNKKSAIIAEGIKSFPDTVKIDIKDVASKLGISTINVGDKIEYTPCYTLKSGTQVNGWSKLGGFNNTSFTSWKLEDGSSFSYRASYTAFAPLQLDKFQGDDIPFSMDGGDEGSMKVSQVNNKPEAKWIPAGANVEDLVGLKFEGDFWFGGDSFTIWINKADYSLIIPDQIMCPGFTYGSYGTFDAYMVSCDGEIDTLYNTIEFTFGTKWDKYSFGGDTVIFEFPR